MDKKQGKDTLAPCGIYESVTSQALGSVSEPTLYGILFKNKACLTAEVIASTIGGSYIALPHTAQDAVTSGTIHQPRWQSGGKAWKIPSV